MQFLRVDDVVPCDFSGDGVVDLLALNHRVSTGYGFVGMGNGLFYEGPSFDLPFRPAAAACIGDPAANNLVLVSVQGAVTLFHPLIAADPPMSGLTTQMWIVALGGDAFSTTMAVIRQDTRFAQVFELRSGALMLVGEYAALPADDTEQWYWDALSWTPGQASVPLPPAGLEGRIALADLNRDGIADSVALKQHGIEYGLSDRGSPLQAYAEIELSFEPIAVRLADLDGNGHADIIALSGSGIVQAFLFCLAPGS